MQERRRFWLGWFGEMGCMLGSRGFWGIWDISGKRGWLGIWFGVFVYVFLVVWWGMAGEVQWLRNRVPRAPTRTIGQGWACIGWEKVVLDLEGLNREVSMWQLFWVFLDVDWWIDWGLLIGGWRVAREVLMGSLDVI